MSQTQSRVSAVLGPTNTGKTHYAIERMLGHRTGIIGLPLRLLAREVYDRIVAVRGPSVVALVTGEERIVPPRTQYWVCTTEAMPEGMGVDFLAVDEIQLCADPERGHVFTERLLNSRGLLETVFLGADTMRSVIAALIPEVQFQHRERFSTLSYTGPKKISRMTPRAAIVGFSVDNVYAVAELLRRQKGGAAVVMGALSPRTRNAQVDMYQNGDVDYLVATDAIGMGLNLDITHVAFSGLRKFDGRRMRDLQPNELAQIAGRAGRYQTDGTFGVTGEAPDLDARVVEAITANRFTPLKKLQWRNSALEFGCIERLIASLERAPNLEQVVRAREADDVMALKSLTEDAEIAARASDGQSVRLLWDVCRIPDFRGISHQEHASLLTAIFNHIHQHGAVPEDWFARQIKTIDRTDGDIDALSKRLAYVRTWTYVAQRKGWLSDEIHWREATRKVEDRLSDALHEALTQRFVDRRTSVLLRRLKQKEALVAEVNDKGEVTVEGEFVGRLEGFRFHQDASASGDEAKTVKAAATAALAPEFHLRADRFYNAPDTEMDFTDQGGLMWGEHAIGKLAAGDDQLKPRIVAFVDEEAGTDITEKVQRRLQHFIDRKIAALFEPLFELQNDESLSGMARGFGFQMVEALGVIDRRDVAADVKGLDQDARGQLRKHGIRFGQFTIFMPLLLKPAPTRLRLVLRSLADGADEFPESPPPGLVTIPHIADLPASTYLMSGYRPAGARAIRIDMLERLADLLRAEDSRGGFEANPDMLSITGMTLEQFADLMAGLGYNAERGEREKPARVDQTIPEAGATVGDTTPVMDARDAAPGGVTEAPEDPKPESYIIDEGRAPIDETTQSADTGAEAAAEGGPPEMSETEIPVGAAADAAVPEDAVEVFYTFTWGGNRNAGQQTRRGKPQGKGSSQGGKPRGKGKPRRDDGGKPQKFEARPPKKDKIDPDNPFAQALMGLKDKGS